MKPIVEGVRVVEGVPGGDHGVRLESRAELGVLISGLGIVKRTYREPNPKLAETVDFMTQIARDLAGASETLLQDPLAEIVVPDTHSVVLDFVEPAHVRITELAVRIVAGSEPGATPYPECQDPIKYQTALDMVNEHAQAADEMGLAIHMYNAD